MGTAQLHTSRKNQLFLILGMIFLTNDIVAEFIGAKIFSLEKTLGIEPLGLNLFGDKFNFDMTAGVILWPIVFILTDLINDPAAICKDFFCVFGRCGQIDFADPIF